MGCDRISKNQTESRIKMTSLFPHHASMSRNMVGGRVLTKKTNIEG